MKTGIVAEAILVNLGASIGMDAVELEHTAIHLLNAGLHDTLATHTTVEIHDDGVVDGSLFGNAEAVAALLTGNNSQNGNETKSNEGKYLSSFHTKRR